MKHALYLIGSPGVGKTSLFRAALRGLVRTIHSLPIPHDGLPGGAAEIGRQREAFGGTDALGMNVVVKAEAWVLSGQAPGLLVAEGDRLACDRFFRALERAGYVLTVALLHANEDTLEARRRARGSAQAPAWIAGRVTKAQRLFETWGNPDWALENETTSDFDAAVHRIRNHETVAAAIRCARAGGEDVA